MRRNIRRNKVKLITKSFDELTSRELYEILRAREDIFTHEKGMICRDIDGDDYNCLHIYLESEGKLAAYLRANYLDGGLVKIGRVLTLTHGVGHGRLLMDGAISSVRKRFGAQRILVHAQCDAKSFYERMGFTPISDEYIEEGVPHISMELSL